MLINYVSGEECRIAIVEDKRLEEFYQERASAGSHVGNIYKGRVVNVESAIQAAFIDFGLERNGFLHVSDLHPMYFPPDSRESSEQVGSKTPRRDRPLIQKCLRRGQDILIQVLKEGIGTKGPTLTSYLSIPGRFLVMMPHMHRHGVSRKVEDDDARRKMRQILSELNPPDEFGFIVRTAGIGQTKTDLKRDLAYLTRLWKSIDRRMKRSARVGELYTESDLVIRTIRDVFTSDITRIVIDDLPAARRARTFLEIANPRAKSKIVYYNDPVPLFHRFDIERQIEAIYSREVPLPSGGSLVFDQAEALVAIDVNSGRSRQARDAETNAFNTNKEAVDEICRQLRLRDLGGVIINDLIDMRHARNRREVETRFRNNLKRDRARTRIGSISQFGILEMTRQRMRPSLKTSIYEECRSCHGSGHVKSPESVVLEVMRRLALIGHRKEVARVELNISPIVAYHLLNTKRAQLVRLEKRFNKPIGVRGSGETIDHVQIAAFDERGGMLNTEFFSDHKNISPQTNDTFVDVGSERFKQIEREAEAANKQTAPPKTEDKAPADQKPETPTEAPAQPTTEPAAEAKPKRRRRRGGRGRRKSGAAQPGEEAPAASTEPAKPEPVPQSAEATGTKKRRRRRRGGRKQQEEPAASAKASPPDDSQTDAADAPKKKRRRRRRSGRKQDNGQTQSSSGSSPTPSGYANRVVN